MLLFVERRLRESNDLVESASSVDQCLEVPATSSGVREHGPRRSAVASRSADKICGPILGLSSRRAIRPELAGQAHGDRGVQCAPATRLSQMT